MLKTPFPPDTPVNPPFGTRPVTDAKDIIFHPTDWVVMDLIFQHHEGALYSRGCPCINASHHRHKLPSTSDFDIFHARITPKTYCRFIAHIHTKMILVSILHSIFVQLTTLKLPSHVTQNECHAPLNDLLGLYQKPQIPSLLT